MALIRGDKDLSLKLDVEFVHFWTRHLFESPLISMDFSG
jgi:hypothetical protein